jgi:hypothetical protein
MLSKPMALRIVSAILLIVLLAGCSSTTPTPAPTTPPQPTVDLKPTLNSVQTQAVQTFVVDMTKNAPTATKVVPTNTPQPTATQAPTATPVKSNPTATEKPQASGPTATLPIFCTISNVLVNGGSDAISAGSTLKLIFVLVNTGSTDWTKSDFSLTYWSGTRFTNQLKIPVPETTGKGSNITIPTNEMTAPSNAGTYHAVWAIVKGFTPYCLMPVTVTVK